MADIKMMIVTPWRIVIGKIKASEDNGQTLVVKDGYIMEYRATKEGITVIPMPIVLGLDPSVEVPFTLNSIICPPIDPPEDMLTGYLELTTGLSLPKKAPSIII